MYRERASSVPGGVMWTNVVTAPEQRILPDGCMDVIWVDGSLIVAGPDSRAYLNASDVGTTFTGLRFAPGTAPALLGVPAHELRDLRVALEAVWDQRTVRQLRAQIGDARSAAHALDIAMADRWRRLDASVEIELASSGYADQAHLAREVKDLAGVPMRALVS